MRLLALIFIGLALLFAGCTQPAQEPQNEAGNNLTPVANPLPQNNSMPVPVLPPTSHNNSTSQQNVSPPSQNITAPVLNATGIQENVSERSNGSMEIEGMRFGNYTLVLEDISIASGPERISCAIIGIYGYGSSSKLAELQGCPGQDIRWVAPDGRTWRIVVYQTAQGYSQEAAWAEIAVFG